MRDCLKNFLLLLISLRNTLSTTVVNTRKAINWFKKIQKKNKYKFMIFDIHEFYSSVSKELPGDGNICITINKEDLTNIQHARRSILYNQKTPWQKKNTKIFVVTVGAYLG